MKKILFIHTTYRNIGGEDVAVNNEINFLKKHYDVQVIKFSNSKISLADFYSFFTNSNLKSNRELQKKINNFNPDFAYIHNTWFKGSLGLFKVLKKNNIEIILKIHNFRYDCTRTFLSRKHLKDKEFCNACGLKKNNVGIFNKYFENSYIKSIFVNNYGIKYFQILKRSNFKILVLTEFHKQYLTEIGIESKRIFVFPNYVDLIEKDIETSREDLIVYAGRISEEKGVLELISAFKKCSFKNTKLIIIGDGPNLSYLKNKFSSKDIEFKGELSNSDVKQLINKSKAVVTATKLFEGQPTLLCEASSLGVSSIYPRSGGISEFFPEENLFSFEQFNYSELVEKLKLTKDNNILKDSGNKNKVFIEEKLNQKNLLKEYEEILDE
tara:strand:- start:323 stop:1468 length:1146 start_codon:yes stop_codon:yes gene_type:complete